MRFESGEKLGDYVILDLIGQGGMGEVYRARDSKLGREVAIKVLPETLAKDPERLSRFAREARLLASLNHPGVAVLHGHEESGSHRFLVMELVPGETLAESLARGPLSVSAALPVLQQVASALEFAHEHGVIHRDLKPDNVRVTPRGMVKLLDFGIAKSVVATPSEQDSESDTRTHQTHAGMVMGTAPYMSPEQVRGQPTDARSDIWSFALLAFEILTGVRAFQGPTAADTFAQILEREPDWSPLADRVPTKLRLLLERCLQKDVQKRCDSMSLVLAELEAIDLTPERNEAPSGEHRSSSRNAIAVLPFTDMSPTRDQEYFCQGMAEEVIGALAKVPGLQVAARTSTFQFADKGKDARAIGDALNVDHLLEGSVRTSANQLRVSAQLIKVDDGYQVWSERFDREMNDVFEVQDEIASKIVAALKVRLESLEDDVRRPTASLDAYHLYLKGRHRWSRRGKGDFQQAKSFFGQAVEADPNYAAAYAGLADVHHLLGVYGFADPQGERRKAEEAIRRAIELDPSLAEAFQASGFHLAHFEWKLNEGVERYRRAIELDPAGKTTARSWLAIILVILGKVDEGMEAAGRAVELDPLSPYAHTARAWAALLAGKEDETLRSCEGALDIAPDYGLALALTGLTLSRRGEHSNAVSAARSAVEGADRAPIYLGWLGYVLAQAGRPEQARAILQELESVSKSSYVSPLYQAWPTSALGAISDALTLLERAAEIRDPQLLYLDHPQYDPLREEPRFLALRRNIGV